MKELKYTKEEIQERRNLILNEFSEKSKNFSSKDLKRLFSLYHRLFFKNLLSEKQIDKLSFGSTLRKDIIGLTEYSSELDKITVKIYINKRLLLSLFIDKTEKNFNFFGIICHNQIECLLVLFEHELLHALEYLIFPDAPFRIRSHNRRFRLFVWNIFQHKTPCIVLPIIYRKIY
jgi:hypothetical protein